MKFSVPFLQQLEERVRREIIDQDEYPEFYESSELERKVDRRMEELANELFYLLTGKI